MNRAKSFIVAQDVDVTPSQRVKGFLDWGKQNLFPQRCIRMVGKSPTASSCVGVRSRFIAGNGIADRALGSMIVNKQGESLDAVHRNNSQNLGFGRVIAYHVGFNGNLDVNSIKMLPFQNFRYAKQDSFGNVNAGGIFPYLDSPLVKNAENKFVKCQLFNPDKEVIEREIIRAGGIEKYNGQIFYVPMLQTGDNYYHKFFWFTAHIAIQTEAELLDFDYKQTVNGFSTSGFYESYEPETMIQPAPIPLDVKDVALPNFNYDTPMSAEVANSRGGIKDEDSVEAQFQKSIGNRNAGNVVFVKHKTKESLEFAKFTPVTGAQLSERNGSLNERIPVTIARAYETPNELVNIRRQGGMIATGAEVESAVNLMYQSINPEQRLHRLSLEYMLKFWHEPLGNISCETEQLDYFSVKSATNGNTIVPSAG